MKPPRPIQRKFAFKLNYSTTTTKNKENLYFFLSIYLLTVSEYQVILYKLNSSKVISFLK